MIGEDVRVDLPEGETRVTFRVPNAGVGEKEAETARPMREVVKTISPDLDAVVLRMLAKKREDRFQDMTSVIYELSKWETRLNELGLKHGGIQDASYGSGLSFRDPDNNALEFFAPPA